MNMALRQSFRSQIMQTRGLEAFGRKVTTTASQLIGPLADPIAHQHYQQAMGEVSKQLRRSNFQRSMFSMAKTSPTDLVRSKLSATEIRQRALSYVPDALLHEIPEDFSEQGKTHRRQVSRGRKLIDEGRVDPDSPHAVQKLKREKAAILHELEMLDIRKNMASSEIREIDNKITNLMGMRKIILESLAGLEQDETVLEHDIMDVENRLEEAEEVAAEAESAAALTPTKGSETGEDDEGSGFMSQSIYEKLPSANSTPPRSRKPRNARKKSMPILHEHIEPGSSIREIRAHQESIIAMDFDAPFGIMVSSALDDTVRVWDLNAGRCIGALDGHTASVRALQVDDNLCATGSMDATIRLWDLGKAHYDPLGGQLDGDEEDGLAFKNPEDQAVDPPAGSMNDCPLTTLQSHMDAITALHMRGNILVSGSADKTLRHWDLEKGRCVQTLDVMWAAAQASASFGESKWKQTSRTPVQDADFVGALQVFEAALACGTADGVVRLWDLRSGQVHRSLIGHTGPVTSLQFDDVHLVTGSLDRSIRIWDLRTGCIYDAFAYDHPITSMMFDSRRIVSAAGEDVAKVYDKLESRHWDCGAGLNAAEAGQKPALIERVRIRDGYMIEGRQDGFVGVWAC